MFDNISAIKSLEYLEISKSSSSLGMNHSLRYSLPVKVSHLLQEHMVLVVGEDDRE